MIAVIILLVGIFAFMVGIGVGAKITHTTEAPSDAKDTFNSGEGRGGLGSCFPRNDSTSKAAITGLDGQDGSPKTPAKRQSRGKRKK